MMIDRRSFLRALLATPLALELDVERLLWVPCPIITVPALRAVTMAEINAITLQSVLPGVIDSFFTNTPLLEYLTRGSYVGDGRRVREIPLP